jgi:hypothetical protein
MKLPDLLFGVATSDHQAEAYDPRRPDFRDQWEKLQGQTLRGRATDFWERYPEDIGLARDLGCKIFRFSISWSRVEPWPGDFDVEILDHYRKITATIQEAGMLPLVTLHHFTWPIHVQERGGMTASVVPSGTARTLSLWSNSKMGPGRKQQSARAKPVICFCSIGSQGHHCQFLVSFQVSDTIDYRAYPVVGIE